MGRCKPMYGLDGNAVKTLRTRFRRLSGDREWHCADDFVKWASENGFKKSARIYKIDENKPHGPNNSYWMKGDSKEAKERYTNEIKKGCAFCRNCVKDICDTGIGCKEWRNYFTKNWNKNIHVHPAVPVMPVVQEGQMVFRYEHPDLVREGIVFENRSNNIPGSQ